MKNEKKDLHYSSKVKASMSVKMQPEFDANGDQTVASMLYGTIDKDYLMRLLVEHREKMLPYNRPVMDARLAKIISIIIEKTLGSARFSGYTPEWKEEFRAHALLIALQYVHNYDPDKTKNASKSNDPYNYIRRMVKCAFFQKWEKLNERSEMVQFVPLDEGILHSCVAMDQYAGLAKQEKQRRHWKSSSAAGLDTKPIDEAVDEYEKIEAEAADDSIMPEADA